MSERVVLVSSFECTVFNFFCTALGGSCGCGDVEILWTGCRDASKCLKFLDCGGSSRRVELSETCSLGYELILYAKISVASAVVLGTGSYATAAAAKRDACFAFCTGGVR